MLDMTTVRPRRLRPAPLPLLLLSHWRVDAPPAAPVTLAHARAGRLRALVAVQRKRAPACPSPSFRARIAAIQASRSVVTA